MLVCLSLERSTLHKQNIKLLLMSEDTGETRVYVISPPAPPTPRNHTAFIIPVSHCLGKSVGSVKTELFRRQIERFFF